ncbi:MULTISPECIES: hypothetical protein [Pseudomonas]|uniref:hypothetical protein n=1 Tax=Pseudomonas TaxID=286 RepID=UPI001AE80CF2|nr:MULTISPECIES: hypothetical protein [unclassified Pseudomonas]MBP2270928.1 hypothetical protein [Pseudomonas sp. BP6]MBP2290102.1 hypothetical protein [Pseudomonas sp. BP7]HDS1695659.1 hypothetical protein [Pseudomonas putida]HDS1700711.1 hypothetical protein [Pseudomonas putida]
MKVIYENWQGLERERNIQVEYLHFGSTEYHTTAQWLLRCTDLDSNEVHDFALIKIKQMAAQQLTFRKNI